jgi:hypothetical protein
MKNICVTKFYVCMMHVRRVFKPYGFLIPCFITKYYVSEISLICPTKKSPTYKITQESIKKFHNRISWENFTQEVEQLSLVFHQIRKMRLKVM